MLFFFMMDALVTVALGDLQNPMLSQVAGLCQGFTMWSTAMLPSSIAARYYLATQFFIQYEKYSICTCEKNTLVFMYRL